MSRRIDYSGPGSTANRDLDTKHHNIRRRLIDALLKRATITINAEPEELQIEGNASATGETTPVCSRCDRAITFVDGTWIAFPTNDRTCSGNQLHTPDESRKANLDDETNAWIRSELAHGNEWAWCCVHVHAEFRNVTGDDYLGGCSYASEKDFKQPGGYYDDMVREAVGVIADQLIASGDLTRELLKIRG